MPLDRFLIAFALILFVVTWMVKKTKPSWYPQMSLLAWFFASLLLVRFFFWELAWTSGPSMLPTIPEKSVIFVNRQAYGFPSPLGKAHSWTEQALRNDVVAFSFKDQMFVKRVRAHQGDYIEMKYPGGWYVNGYYAAPLSPKSLDWLWHAGFSFQGYDYNQKDNIFSVRESWHAQKSFGLVVPYGFLFVIGDNPYQSTDSRDFGLVPMDHVIGRVDILKKGEI